MKEINHTMFYRLTKIQKPVFKRMITAKEFFKGLERISKLISRKTPQRKVVKFSIFSFNFQLDLEASARSCQALITTTITPSTRRPTEGTVTAGHPEGSSVNKVTTTSQIFHCKCVK